MTMLSTYFIRIFPALFLLTITFILAYRLNVWIKIFLMILGFILMRDGMTPVGIWQFGVTDSLLWLRFIDSGLVLIILAVLTLILALVLYFIHPQINQDIVWFSKNKYHAFLVGIGAAILIVLPFMLPYLNTPIEARGGNVSWQVVFPLLIFALLGNFLEELLFRGFLQSQLKLITNKWHAIVLSGLIFALGHIFLAITVTDLGVIVLLFTFWEGLICAFLYERYGLIAASIAHGLGIFLISAGLF